MKVVCTECKAQFDCDLELAGSTTYCPECGAEVYVKTSRDRKMEKYREYIKSTSSRLPEKPAGGLWLCFVLGFFLTLVGVLLSALIKGKEGAKRAAEGMVIAIILYVIAVAVQ